MCLVRYVPNHLPGKMEGDMIAKKGTNRNKERSFLPAVRCRMHTLSTLIVDLSHLLPLCALDNCIITPGPRS